MFTLVANDGQIASDVDKDARNVPKIAGKFRLPFPHHLFTTNPTACRQSDLHNAMFKSCSTELAKICPPRFSEVNNDRQNCYRSSLAQAIKFLVQPVGSHCCIICQVSGPMEDSELVRRCLQGDNTAFDELVRRYRDRVYGIAIHLLHDRELAEDIAQEAFLRIFQKLALFDQNKGSFSNWVATLTVRLCLNALKRRDYAQQISVNTPNWEGNEVQLQDCSESPEELWWLSEQQRIIRDLLDTLPPMQRAVLLLRYGEDLSVREIAEALKVPTGTVKAWLFRGREILRKKLKEVGII